jgi:hypothetical protein
MLIQMHVGWVERRERLDSQGERIYDISSPKMMAVEHLQQEAHLRKDVANGQTKPNQPTLDSHRIGCRLALKGLQCTLLGINAFG